MKSGDMRLGSNKLFIFTIGVSLPILFGRFGAYIPSPIPYLPLDCLLLAIFLMCNLSVIKEVPKCLIGYFIICFLFILSKMFWTTIDNYSIAIRGLAPVLYMMYGIFCGFVITGNDLKKITNAIKIFLIVFIGQYILFSIVLPPEITINVASISNLSEYSAYPDFPSDFSGVLASVGFVLWYSGENCLKKNWKAFLFAAIAVSPSRTAAICFLLIAIYWILLNNRNGLMEGLKHISMLFAAIVFFGVLKIILPLALNEYVADRSENHRNLPVEVAIRIYRESSIFRAYDEVSANYYKGFKNSTSDRERKQPRIDNSVFEQQRDKDSMVECLNYGNCGTVSARVATWKYLINYLHENQYLLFGAPLGKESLLDACLTYGYKFTPDSIYIGGGEFYDKCPVESSFSTKRLIDPHNGFLYILMSLGCFGLFLFFGPILFILYKSTSVQLGYRIYRTMIFAIIISSITTTLLSSSYGLLLVAMGMIGLIFWNRQIFIINN